MFYLKFTIMKFKSNLLLFSVLITGLVVFSSCSKRKEQKAWKALYGNYEISSPVLMYTFDDGEEINAVTMNISETAIAFYQSSDDVYSCEFFSKPESDNSNYDYQIYFNQTRLYVFNTSTMQMDEQPSPSEEDLNANVKFYLKRSGDGLILVVNRNNVESLYTLNKVS